MQNFRCVSAFAAMAVFAPSLLSGGAAFAQAPVYRAEAKLFSGASAPREETIGNASWRCDGDACVGSAARKGNLDGVVRECRKVVAVIGPVAAYKTGARQLTDGELKACNRGAPAAQTIARN